jgi:hypothetical protein
VGADRVGGAYFTILRPINGFLTQLALAQQGFSSVDALRRSTSRAEARVASAFRNNIKVAAF